MSDLLFHKFDKDISNISLPNKFTFPFYYTPHKLAELASEQLMSHLQTQKDWDHNFGLDASQSGLIIGKMFGILVVRDAHNDIGFLAAFSGKLANENNHPYFVPPVFDILNDHALFQTESEVLNNLNRQIKEIEDNEAFHTAMDEFDKIKSTSELALKTEREELKIAKDKRKVRRNEGGKTLSASDLEILKDELKDESLKQQYFYKKSVIAWEEKTAQTKLQYDFYAEQLNSLKQLRKAKSAALQQELFDSYSFLNKDLKMKSLKAIFNTSEAINPPAGAGECAAPKLLHYAFLNGYEPLAMAEFWWGQSPNSEIRKHGQFYPACRGKCEPILAHMLEGIKMDDNPMLENIGAETSITTVFEDEYILVINKPADLLSVPGINVEDSVFKRIQAQYPNASGPLLVHRLDMSTSGILVIAKDKEVHKQLQKQFIRRTIKKRYIALLDGIIEQDKGVIDLPLRVDLDDRPRQLVCFEHGKPAQTIWKKIAVKNNKTLIYFYPITGRTHQLRVHSAHPLGLNTAIVGDDLYGDKGTRLHLHAEFISFTHPITKELIKLKCKPDF